LITRETKADELSELMKADLANIELDLLTKPYSLADAIRDGIKVTKKARCWGSENSACALSAAAIAAKSKGLI
jgi:hypothetical protein